MNTYKQYKEGKNKFLNSICCNFNLLEEKAKKYREE